MKVEIAKEIAERVVIAKEIAERKRQEIFEIIKETVATYHSNPNELALKIFDNFFEITPPKIEIYKIGPKENYYKHDSFCCFFMTLISDKLGPREVKSIKPGNILLNWKKILECIPESIITTVHSIAVPWLIPLAALAVLIKLLQISTIKLDERYAAAIWTMWQYKDENNSIEKDKILELVNKELSKFDRKEMTEEELNSILNVLEKIKCIRQIENKYFFNETINIKYEE